MQPHTRGSSLLYESREIRCFLAYTNKSCFNTISTRENQNHAHVQSTENKALAIAYIFPEFE